MPQLRKNIITGEWVVIAPERARRPRDFVNKIKVKATDASACVFCQDSNNYRQNRLREFDTDNVYVIANKYPAFVEDPALCSPRSYHVEDGFFVAKPSLGGHDVVVVKRHSLTLYDFETEVWRDLLVVFRSRYRYFDKLCNTESTIAIYNEKPPAGASIVHPHAQILSSNIVPELITKEINECKRYFETKGASAFARLVEHEKRFAKRIVEENEDYLAFTQYAARFPFEVWVVPKYQSSRFDMINSRQVASLIPLLSRVITKIGRALSRPPLNFFIHSAPNSLGDAAFYRWHIEMMPRVTTFGGFELASNIVIDVVSPELAAGYLNSSGEA